jgi:diguanylate cyclase (GGDEF)-like protein
MFDGGHGSPGVPDCGQDELFPETRKSSVPQTSESCGKRKFRPLTPVSGHTIERKGTTPHVNPDDPPLPLPSGDRTIRALARSVAHARDPLVRFARGLARETARKPELVARELATLTGAGYAAVYLLNAAGDLELAAGAGPEPAPQYGGTLARLGADTIVSDEDGIAAPLVAGGVTLGAIIALPGGARLQIDHDLVRAVADLAASALAVDSRLAASRAEARRDAVTGLGNRRAFDEHLAEMVATAAAGGGSTALLLLDLDGLKSVNDSQGHAAGDVALREVARVLARSVRPDDAVFRLGGDEFAVVLAGRRSAAVRVGERIRRGLRQHRRADLPSVSGGIAVAPAQATTVSELARKADGALYAAKAAGRDRILAYESDDSFSMPAATAELEERTPLQALIVDDDAPLRELVRTVLEGAGVEVDEAMSAAAMRVHLSDRTPDVLVLDLGLPDADGLELCRELKASRPTLPIVVLTGHDAVAAEGSAVSAGADAFLHKPFGPLELIDVVERLAGRSERGQQSARAVSGTGGGQTQLLARDLRSLLEIERGQRLLLQRAYRQTVTALAAALESKDTSTEAHSKRVQRYAFLLAAAVDPLLIDDPSVEYGFLLHDIGKIGIPDHILKKPGPLTASERRLMETHTILGEQLLADVEILHGSGIKVVRSHHERWDGGGYPDRLAGRDIPLGARVFAVADTLDAITSNRPYRPTGTWNDAVAEIERNAGTQFDPAIVEAFADCESSLREIHAVFAAA